MRNLAELLRNFYFTLYQDLKICFKKILKYLRNIPREFSESRPWGSIAKSEFRGFPRNFLSMEMLISIHSKEMLISIHLCKVLVEQNTPTIPASIQMLSWESGFAKTCKTPLCKLCANFLGQLSCCGRFSSPELFNFLKWNLIQARLNLWYDYVPLHL